MKKALAVITASLLMLSSASYAKHYVIVDNSGFSPVVYQYHKVHYYPANYGYYVRPPKVRHVYYDPYAGRYMVVHKRHPVYVVNYQPTPVFQLNF